MTLEQLRIFVAVAEREHVTQAAQALNLTQSATSAAVAALETRYATRLFDRVGRRVVLTEAGRLFLEEARAVLARALAAETVLADLAGLKAGAVVLGASQTAGNYWLPPLMHRFRQANPAVGLSLRIGNTRQVTHWVVEGAVDLGFVEGMVDETALMIEPVADDRMVLVVAPGQRWATHPPLTAAELVAGPWVLREAGSGTRAMCTQALVRRGVDAAALVVALELPSNEAVRAAVEAGAGATVISRLVVAGALKVGALIAVDMPLETRQFLLLRHRQRHLTRAARAFIDQLSQDRVDRVNGAAPPD